MTTSETKRLDTVGLLAAQCAHDINNHLTAIGWFVELALAQARDRAAREPVEEIRCIVERAAELTSRLLSLSRPLSRRPASRLEATSLSEVVRGLEPMLHALVGDDVDLVLDLARDLTPVRVDRCEIEQVILNLAINARQAMTGGGTLAIRTETLDATQASSHKLRPRTGILLTIADTGEGMDAMTQRRLFEPWFTTKPPDKGTGLGLSRAQVVVSRAGGRISVSSEPGKGTTFAIYLPVMDEDLSR